MRTVALEEHFTVPSLVRRISPDAISRRGFGKRTAAPGRVNPLDLLPEQSSPEGTPAWVLPLGWSHAMLLLAARPELRLVAALREDQRYAGDGRGG